MIITFKINQKNSNLNIFNHANNYHKTQNFSLECKKWNNYKNQNFFNQMNQKGYLKMEFSNFGKNSKTFNVKCEQKRKFSSLNPNKKVNTYRINHFKLFNLIHKQKDSFMKRNFSNLEKSNYGVCEKCGVNNENFPKVYKIMGCNFFEICKFDDKPNLSTLIFWKILHLLFLFFCIWVGDTIELYNYNDNILIHGISLIILFSLCIAAFTPCLNSSMYLILFSIPLSFMVLISTACLNIKDKFNPLIKNCSKNK